MYDQNSDNHHARQRDQGGGMTLATVEAVVPTFAGRSVCPQLWHGSPYTAPARGEEEGRGV